MQRTQAESWLIFAFLFFLLCISSSAQVATTTTLTNASPLAPRFGQVVTLTAQVVPGTAQGSVSLIGDFNADGKADLAVATNYNVNVLLGNGDRHYTTDITLLRGTR